MSREAQYLLAADALLTLHTAIVIFIVASLPLILLGGRLGWRWVANPWYRATHLVATGYVIAQAWLGEICPLTRWEMALRQKAGDTVYSGSFIARWLESLLYYTAPEWVFIAAYTVFGLAVLTSWIWVRPRRFRGQD